MGYSDLIIRSIYLKSKYDILPTKSQETGFVLFLQPTVRYDNNHYFMVRK